MEEEYKSHQIFVEAQLNNKLYSAAIVIRFSNEGITHTRYHLLPSEFETKTAAEEGGIAWARAYVDGEISN